MDLIARESPRTSKPGAGRTSASRTRVNKRRSAARNTLARIPCARRPRSAYYEDGNRPFREPILQDVSQGGIHAVITRNSLGCEVLNTDCMAFADLDYVPPRVPFLEGLFDFGGKKAAARQAAWETETRKTLQAWQGANPSWAFRVYRTAGGLRLLATSQLLPAGTPESTKWPRSRQQRSPLPAALPQPKIVPGAPDAEAVALRRKATLGSFSLGNTAAAGKNGKMAPRLSTAIGTPSPFVNFWKPWDRPRPFGN